MKKKIFTVYFDGMDGSATIDWNKKAINELEYLFPTWVLDMKTDVSAEVEEKFGSMDDLINKYPSVKEELKGGIKNE